MATGNTPYQQMYPDVVYYDAPTGVPTAYPPIDGKGNYTQMTNDPPSGVQHDRAHAHPSAFQPVMPPGNQSQPQAYPPAQANHIHQGHSNYTANHQPPEFYHDPTKAVRLASDYGRHPSRLICKTFHANQVMGTGIIMWVLSVILYAVPNIYFVAIAGALNFLAIICMCIPCIWGHNCCDHDDHSCCYGEYH
jgi:hypothetical protein